MRRLICWDMDETLGSLRSAKNPVLTRDIRNVLEKLMGAGYRHAITTLSTSSFAEQQMRDTGLLYCFEGIFGLSDVLSAGRGKSYSKVAFKMGIGNTSDELLVVGNDIMDAPTDVDAVFLLHPKATDYSAEVFFTIIAELGKSGSWMAGFSAMRGMSGESVLGAGFSGDLLSVDQISIMLGQADNKGKIVPNVVLVNQIPEKYRI